jgi:hypothetical protein
MNADGVSAEAGMCTHVVDGSAGLLESGEVAAGMKLEGLGVRIVSEFGWIMGRVSSA